MAEEADELVSNGWRDEKSREAQPDVKLRLDLDRRKCCSAPSWRLCREILGCTSGDSRIRLGRLGRPTKDSSASLDAPKFSAQSSDPGITAQALLDGFSWALKCSAEFRKRRIGVLIGVQCAGGAR